jgi:hypothetical protein
MPQGQERDAFGPAARAVEGAQQSLVQQLVPLANRMGSAQRVREPLSRSRIRPGQQNRTA